MRLLGVLAVEAALSASCTLALSIDTRQAILAA